MLVNPTASEPRAGIVLIPKRFCIDDAVLHSARSMADKGFTVQVVELARSPVTIDNVTLEQIIEGAQKTRTAARELRRELGPDRNVGAMGAWLGGTLALMTSDEDFDACVAVSPFVRLPVADDVIIRQPLEVAARARCPILAVFGELDAEVPVEDIRAMEGSLNDSPIDDETYTYPGVGHAFFDKEEGNTEYREAAERDLWQRIERFFNQRIA